MGYSNLLLNVRELEQEIEHEIEEIIHTADEKRKPGKRTEPADDVLTQIREHEWSRYVKTLLTMPDWIDLGFENRTRFETMDHPVNRSAAAGGGRTDAQIALRSRLRTQLGGNGPLRILFEGQDARSFLDRDPGDFRNATTVNEFDVLQLFGSITARNLFGTGLRTDVHFGRMTLDFGRRRLVARNDYRNTTNAFDGVHWYLAKDGAWRLRAFFTEPVTRFLDSADSVNHKNTFWGAYAESRYFPWLKGDIYYLGLNDRRTPDVNEHRTYSTVGFRLFKDDKPGELDYELESTYQFGTKGREDHFAYFQHLDLGYTFDVAWTPRIVLHGDYASGDRDPNDGKSRRFDSLFGARRFEYMPTGIVGPFFRTNLTGGGWRLIVAPAKGWILQIKQRFWYLAESRDFFGSSGLRDTTGGSGRNLGHDLELRAQWFISNNLDFDVGWWHWFKGSYFERLPPTAGLPAGGEKDTDYFYIQMRVRM
ncbi:alginate export family protein [Candidatus Nitrospira inopinata]|uniref:alginate export family protein n=1 Tax=Candidatus Nitrospira inopinata TaxID=1715989 RepID=UPI00078379E8|nr:alginate export family protein [Candidatus Nitrospira inopinata]